MAELGCFTTGRGNITLVYNQRSGQIYFYQIQMGCSCFFMHVVDRIRLSNTKTGFWKSQIPKISVFKCKNVSAVLFAA